ncbi:hypothetical protein V1639_00970 [Pseudarthrobacter sp. J75]|uniref:hypothetical protein n=1 Tax=unclassified Pseudarthrobacter TaxID=2647000 RepID=UPI002E7FBE1C|nr:MULTISPECIES: hypothetical protein [unclassified Pseudarthrobacter]MEE2524572.1 hypothetical protein [Pseudarthrobacter sp. J47]MEE2527599.1 hypothetical protein [Pseudarthrobacter sp. J75]
MKNLNFPGRRLALLALASLLLAGCASAAGAEGHGSHGAHGTPHGSTSNAVSSSGTPADGPSDASLMVCGGQVMGNVVSILGLEAEPHTVNTWSNSTFTCTYHLPDGDLVVSVQEAADQSSALNYFDAMQALAVDARPIEGLANLGFPAYETPDGSAVFQKDRMILHVDASGLPEQLGPEGITPTAFAYQLSTTILACWKEHP